MATARETAFTWRQWNSVQETIRNMNRRALTHLRHGMTGKNLFDAFVREDDKEALTHVFKLCDVKVEQQSFDYELRLKNVEIEQLTADMSAKFSISLRNDAKFKFLFPKYMAKAKLHQASPELENVFQLIASINFEWARVYQVLEALNNICKTPAQMKTVCPHLAAMLADYESTKDLGERMLGMRDSQTLPAIPLELRQHALYIGQAITKGLLVPKESEAPEDEFTITMEACATKKERWDGTSWACWIRL